MAVPAGGCQHAHVALFLGWCHPAGGGGKRAPGGFGKSPELPLVARPALGHKGSWRAWVSASGLPAALQRRPGGRLPLERAAGRRPHGVQLGAWTSSGARRRGGRILLSGRGVFLSVRKQAQFSGCPYRGLATWLVLRAAGGWRPVRCPLLGRRLVGVPSGGPRPPEGVGSRAGSGQSLAHSRHAVGPGPFGEARVRLPPFSFVVVRPVFVFRRSLRCRRELAHKKKR